MGQLNNASSSSVALGAWDWKSPATFKKSCGLGSALQRPSACNLGLAAVVALTVNLACANPPSGPSGGAVDSGNAAFDVGADSGSCSDDSGCGAAFHCKESKCVADLCDAATPATCEGTLVKTCKPNGSDWVTTACGAGFACDKGKCISTKPTCPPKEIADDFAKQDQLLQSYKTCANADGCMGKADDAARAACFAACVGKTITLTASCGTCLGQYAVCLFSVCKGQCSVDPSAKPCESCATTGCDPALAMCGQ